MNPDHLTTSPDAHAAAIAEYDRVFRANLSRERGQQVSDAEWAALRTSDLVVCRNYQPGDPNSALFARLLSGKPALPYPPPVSNSIPWYEVIESERPIENVTVVFEGEAGPAPTLDAHGRASRLKAGHGVVLINQEFWTLLERNGDEALVTYGEWERAGFTWRLTWAYRRVDDLKSRFHLLDRRGVSIRTRAQLWQHCVETFALRRDAYECALSGGVHHGAIPNAEVQWAGLDIARRRAAGLPLMPTDRELTQQARAAYRIQMRGGSSSGRPMWRVDRDLHLARGMWTLTRVKPPA